MPKEKTVSDLEIAFHAACRREALAVQAKAATADGSQKLTTQDKEHFRRELRTALQKIDSRRGWFF